jgi:putative ABC transport system ATP-binding protein
MVEIDNAIKIKDLNVIYNKGKENQVRALDGVNLEFQVNEWVILFGPSGCGKSTLLNSIAGLETPTSGKVQVLGKDIHSLSSDSKAEYRRKSVGMIFQSFHLINSLSVVDNVCLPQVFYGISLKKRRELALSFLDRFGIKSQAEKYPMDISGGQRQRVSIARALMNKPEIILSVTVADCFPVFLFDSKQKVIGILHCGWRSVAKNIIENCVDKMRTDFNSKSKNLLISIGPGIQKCHFQVGKEFIVNFHEYDEFFNFENEKIFFDLNGVIVKKLIFKGIHLKNIENDESCTFCNERLWSYRRDGVDKNGDVQAMIAGIKLKN